MSAKGKCKATTIHSVNDLSTSSPVQKHMIAPANLVHSSLGYICIIVQKRMEIRNKQAARFIRLAPDSCNMQDVVRFIPDAKMQVIRNTFPFAPYAPIYDSQ
ncbi:unnamed protein product [Gongylonema pulchrum]|uniref:MSP domain-containing protein n=1 Tax=Gongylonema pulchrum TaxID=637853 RepID=A0A183EJ29_9BILA|nr:unnamed protein product [Gongylonema pulchrum]